MSDITRILSKLESGDPSAAEELLPLVYAELRQLAAARMADERAGHTLQATALVHEAYLRLVGSEPAKEWNSRGHFFSAAGEAMRRILVERARARRAEKRGGERNRRDFDDAQPADQSDPELVLAISDALEVLATEDERVAALVKLRCFAGFTLEQAADALAIGESTAYKYWAYAKSRLWVLLNPA